MYYLDEFENSHRVDQQRPKVIFTLQAFNCAMAYNNAIPIGVIVGLVSSIILLILALRWLRHKNNQKEAREQDMEAAKVEASAFDDGASDNCTPIASPRDALFQPSLHNKSVVSLFAEPNKTEKEWSDARRAQERA
ncbi:hypothetical protein AUEXF2481DRAFT_41348 [Aureobasidium subglaciale EXF-2481]|uniref:Uncharacterized protein n=1 Tax=Aureobasidium subglaciale (strain EXF-2481) TaxID=1043005 RepID=A0A074Y8W1_AURSE|nr:uncharacterized protein AUEXF2481DRAFT_41348 [Aureobasidium subglaciale EXF-2481]KEQ94170.1 hypothetical protein AUEXF2481DRAFT_41348 [Aureobasidium subglaciale EXF-2481]